MSKGKNKGKSSPKGRTLPKELTSATQVSAEGKTPSATARLAEVLKAKDFDAWQKKQIRHKIYSDFKVLSKITDGSEISRIAEFILQYEDKLDLVRQALEQLKYSPDFHAVMIWSYLSGKADERLDRLVLEKKLLEERRTWLETQLPNLIVFSVETTERGPDFEAITPERIQHDVRQHSQESTSDVQVDSAFPFSRPGDYLLHLKFLGGIKLSRILRLELRQDELPLDCADGLANTPPLPLNAVQDILKELQQRLADVSPNDVLVYYPRMSSVLRTAYEGGYWKSPWVQSVLQEWRARRGEYLLNQELRDVGEYVESLNRGALVIPEEDDNEPLTEQRILQFAQEVISRETNLSQYTIDLRFDGSTERSVLPVEVLLKGLPVGTLTFLKPVTFLPADVRREIQRANISGLERITAYSSEDELLTIADRETGDALKIIDRQHRPDYSARAERLAGICRILFEQGYVDNIQFKRTLSCYYAARGGGLFKADPLKARTYYLLFFRMLYQEGMIEHLKAFRALDYPVLASLFATYASNQARSAGIPSDSEILHNSNNDLKPQTPMLWRVAQLLSESPQSFFDALLSLYEIDEDFVRNLLITLRRIRRAGVFDLDYLQVDSARLPRDIVAYAVETAPVSITTDLL